MRHQCPTTPCRPTATAGTAMGTTTGPTGIEADLAGAQRLGPGFAPPLLLGPGILALSGPDALSARWQSQEGRMMVRVMGLTVLGLALLGSAAQASGLGLNGGQFSANAGVNTGLTFGYGFGHPGGG